jgi:hypothetical protein
MKGATNNPKKQAKADDRFNEVYSDPRFMTVPKKLKKVEIDDRFKKALTSKEFNLVQKVDKYGHTVNKQDNTMKQFYQIKDAKEAKPPADSKYYDEDGKFKWDAQSSSEDEEDGDGSGEQEESEQVAMDLSEDDESNIWSDVEVKQEEGQLAQAEEVSDLEAGHRLALTNMDWDNLNATDILALFTSLCKGDMIIEKVEIYPSLFGLE